MSSDPNVIPSDFSPEASGPFSSLSDRSAMKSACGCGGSCGGNCPTCQQNAARLQPGRASFIYAFGKIRPSVSNLGLEKEIATAAGQRLTNGESDEEALRALLVVPEYRYLATEACWSLRVDEVDAYILRPADTNGLDAILRAIGSDKGEDGMDIVIGRSGPMTGFSECNGSVLPVVIPTQVYSVNRPDMLKAFTPASGIRPEAQKSAIKQTLDVMRGLAGNQGSADGHRALNYVISRYAGVYEEVAKNLLEGWALSGLQFKASPIASGRRLVDVIFAFRSRKTDAVQKSFVRVDTTDLFPFLVQPMAPYFDMS